MPSPGEAQPGQGLQYGPGSLRAPQFPDSYIVEILVTSSVTCIGSVELEWVFK